MTSVIRGDDNFDTEDTLLGLAKISCNFDGTGTPAIRKSKGVLGITDLGAGKYRLTFETATPDNQYIVLLGNSYDLSDQGIADQASFGSPTTNTIDIFTGNYATSTSFRDSESINIGVFY